MKNLIIFIILSFHFSMYLPAQSVEYTIKALLIEKFARFTNLETDISGEYFTIAVLGKSPFRGELEKSTAKSVIKNKQVKIIYIKDIDEYLDCNLLFICASEKNTLPEILSKISSRPILTIADTDGYAKKGVHLNFYIDTDGTIVYEINPKALEKAKLTVNMQVLKFGKIVN